MNQRHLHNEYENRKEPLMGSRSSTKGLVKLAAVIAALLAISAPTLARGQTANETVPLFTVVSRFDALSGALFYDKLDRNGFTVQRVAQYFATPPIASCNLTLWGTILQSLQNESISAPAAGLLLNATTPLQCCDYFSPKVGYEFTQCDNGIGPYIFENRKNTPLSLQFRNDQNLGFNNVSWGGFFQLIN